MKKIEAKRDLAYYMSLPYTMLLKRDEEGDVLARIPELDGCLTHGSDEAEAIHNLKAMQSAWIEQCIELGRPVPEPTPSAELPSGKWLQRVPRSLHRQLIQLAIDEKVSLNTLVTTILSEAAASKVFSSCLVGMVNNAVAKMFSVQPRGHSDFLWSLPERQPRWITAELDTRERIVPSARKVLNMMIPQNVEIFKDANKEGQYDFTHSR